MHETRIGFRRFSELLFANRIRLACLLAAITVIAALFAGRVTIDNSVEIWFLEDDPDLMTYEAFTERFDFDETVVIALFAENIFLPEFLSVIDEITRAAETAPFVDRVLSITNATFPESETTLDERPFRTRVLDNRVLNGTFVTPDSRGAAIIVHVTREGNEFRNKRALVSALQAIIEKHRHALPVTIRMSGTPVIDDAAMSRSERNAARMVPLIIAVIVVIPLLIFRNLVLALVPLIVVSMAALWAYGFMGLVGWRVTLISTLLTPLILVVGVADAVHLLSHYIRQLKTGRPHHAAVVNTLSRLLKPCSFTTTTTIAGLLSLSIGRLEPIREFAVTASVGVLAAFIISLGLVPAALGLVRNRARVIDSTRGALDWLPSSSSRFAPLILIASGIVVALSIGSAQRLRVGVDPMSWFPEDDPVRIDTEQIDAAMSGSVSLEFLVSTAPGGFQDPAILRRLDEFQRWLENETPVGRVISIVDFLKEATRASFREGPDLPATRLVSRMLMEEIEQRDELAQWVTEEYSSGRLSARVPLSRAVELIEKVPTIEAEIATRFSDESVQIELTGYATLMVEMEQYVIANQMNSLIVAFVSITLMMAVLLRSWRLALIGMVPNAAPVIVGLGAMPLLGIGLNPGTVMIGAVALGIVVDDTVHFLSAYDDRRRQGATVDDALQSAIQEVGRPVVITSLLLATGFAMLLLGSFVPSQQVGVTIAIIVVSALFADLFLLPSMLSVVERGGRRLSGRANGFGDSRD